MQYNWNTSDSDVSGSQVRVFVFSFQKPLYHILTQFSAQNCNLFVLLSPTVACDAEAD